MDHSKTEPFENRTILFGFGMVGPYRDAICINSVSIRSDHPKSEQNSSVLEWFGFRMVHPIAMAYAMMDHSRIEPF